MSPVSVQRLIKAFLLLLTVRIRSCPLSDYGYGLEDNMNINLYIYLLEPKDNVLDFITNVLIQ